MRDASFYDYDIEISAPASHIANAYMKMAGNKDFLIDPEIIAEVFFGLRLVPIKGIYKFTGVISGIDATQSTLFIDEDIYMKDETQHRARLAIAHEIGHIIYDSPMLRSNAPQTVEEAYIKHSNMKSFRNIEARANMFAGALLAPRKQLLIQAGEILSQGINDLKDSNPDMSVGAVLDALSGDKLTRRFGISNSALDWRLKSEKFLRLLDLDSTQPLSSVDAEEVVNMCKIESIKKVPSLTDRVKRLLPEGLLSVVDS